MNKKKIIMLVSSVLVCMIAGIAGSTVTAPEINGWYETLEKPSFNPPNWVFAPVWTALFMLMGVSLYLVLDKGLDKKHAKQSVGAFAVQLVLNMMWSFLFFGIKSPFLAFADIILLWIAILATIILFCRISVKAGILLVPYILWVSFAAFLNYSIWMLNP